MNHNQIQIISIDPGKTTGICSYTYEISQPYLFPAERTIEVLTSTMEWDERLEIIPKLLFTPADFIVVEDFRVYKHKAEALSGSHIYSSELIGMIEAFRHHFYPRLSPVHRQMAVERKQAKIPKSLFTKMKTQHERDAFQHAKFFSIATAPQKLKEMLDNLPL